MYSRVHPAGTVLIHHEQAGYTPTAGVTRRGSGSTLRLIWENEAKRNFLPQRCERRAESVAQSYSASLMRTVDKIGWTKGNPAYFPYGTALLRIGVSSIRPSDRWCFRQRVVHIPDSSDAGRAVHGAIPVPFAHPNNVVNSVFRHAFRAETSDGHEWCFLFWKYTPEESDDCQTRLQTPCKSHILAGIILTFCHFLHRSSTPFVGAQFLTSCHFRPKGAHQAALGPWLDQQ